MSHDTQPAWLEALRAACAAQSQVEVAKRLGYSAAVVSAALKGTYKGDLKRVQTAVEGALMQATVDCPVVGELPRQRCAENQRRSFAATNPARVAFHRACPSCPNRSSSP